MALGSGEDRLEAAQGLPACRVEFAVELGVGRGLYDIEWRQPISF